jgi:hypothetical protein
MPADDGERLFGHRQGQQVGEVGAAADAPGDVLRHEIRHNALGNLPNAIEMRLVQTFGTAEREADTVQRYGNIAPDNFETADR